MTTRSIVAVPPTGPARIFTLRTDRIWPQLSIRDEGADPFEVTTEIPMPDFNQGEAE